MAQEQKTETASAPTKIQHSQDDMLKFASYVEKEFASKNPEDKRVYRIVTMVPEFTGSDPDVERFFKFFVEICERSGDKITPVAPVGNKAMSFYRECGEFLKNYKEV